MKTLRVISLFLFLIIGHSVLAQKLLMPPKGQPPQCEQSYLLAEKPQTLNNVLSSVSNACHYAGGSQVMHNLSVQGVTLSCTGSDPDKSVFSCFFSASPGDLSN